MIWKGDTNQTVTTRGKKIALLIHFTTSKKFWPGPTFFWQIGFCYMMVRPWPNPSYIYGRVPPFYGLSILGTTPPFQIRVVEWAWTFHILCSKGEKIDSNFKPLWLLLIESIKSCISALLLLLADVWPKEERRAKSPFHRCYEGWFMIRMMANYSNIWIAVTLLPIANP